MNHVLTSLYYAALRMTGLAALGRRRNAGLVLCYHNVTPNDAQHGAGDPGIHLSIDRFTTQISWLRRHYDVIPLAEFVHRLRTGRPMRRLATITFDDAYAGVFELAVPLLRDLDVPATIFVVADAADSTRPYWWDQIGPAALDAAERDTWLGELRGDAAAILERYSTDPALVFDGQRPADWDTIRASLHSGLAVGAHSITHRALTALEDHELEQEIVASRDAIRGRTGAAPDFFTYPYGLWSPRVRAAVRAAGFSAALTLDYGLNPPKSDPWALKRVNVPATIADDAFQAWSSGLSLHTLRR